MFLDYLLGFVDVFLYSILFSIIVFIFSFLVKYVWEKINIKIWVLKSLLITYIFGFFVLLIMYFIPVWYFGLSIDAFALANDFWQKVVVVLSILLHILYVDIYVSLVAQPFLLVFDYMYEKWKEKQILLRVFVPIYITIFILLTINMFFPFIMGGLLLILYS